MNTKKSEAEALLNIEDGDEYWSKDFTGIDCSDREIASKEFDGCSFQQCNFAGATFNACKFVDCEFSNCNMSLLNFDFSKFSNVSVRDSKLVGVNWTKVAWSSFIYSSPIKFYNSILNDCSFYGLTLQELILIECKAHYVDFREGDFSNADFACTDFSGCLFDNTNLSAANFSEATDYDIDINRNDIGKARFSRYEALRLLAGLDIELAD